MAAKKANMELFLQQIFNNYVAISDSQFKKCDEIFRSVFSQVKEKMSEVDNFYGKYSSQVQHAGSVYDGVKVGKLDEFDMDVVIRLPINYDDGIELENHKAGFVKVKIGKAFDNLDVQPNWEKCHKVTREWRDAEKYFLQNKFRFWMQATVQKAVNLLQNKVVVNDITYNLSFTESGPAFTLKIRRSDENEKFELDVDLVPVIRFQVPRWPEGYRTVEGSQCKDWYIVPKPIKSLNDNDLKNRCWRLAFHEFEREHIKGCDKLKTTIRLVKKLRDGLQMKEIASYYIKTLFLWEVDERGDKKYWQNKITVIFRDMVAKLHKAIEEKSIPYYWNKDYNLIEGMRDSKQKIYCDKLKEVLHKLDANDVESVTEALLTQSELDKFKDTEFYKLSTASLTEATTSATVKAQKRDKPSLSVDTTDSKTSSTSNNDDMMQLLNNLVTSNRRLENKIDLIINRVKVLEEKLQTMSIATGENDSNPNNLIITELNTNNNSGPDNAKDDVEANLILI